MVFGHGVQPVYSILDILKYLLHLQSLGLRLSSFEDASSGDLSLSSIYGKSVFSTAMVVKFLKGILSFHPLEREPVPLWDLNTVRAAI